jgi:PAS domain S-box-containing protein
MRIRIKLPRAQFGGWKGYLFAVAMVILATWFKHLAQPNIIPANIPILYILAIVFTATFFGLVPALLSCVLSLLAYNYFFIVPIHTFTLNIEQLPISIVFLIVGIIISYLSSNLREKTEEAKKEVVVRKQNEAELISYREHLEDLVKQETARNNAALSSLLAGVGVYDRTGKLLSLNAAGQAMLGYTRSDLVTSIGARINKIRAETPDGKPIPTEESIPIRALKGEIVRNYVFRMHSETGEIRWIMGDGSPVLGENGEITGAVLTVIDITEQKNAEEQLRRLNRELLAISECNQAIVRATDEPALLTEVCRIMCEVVGYRMAWLGIVEHDEAKSIRPVAWSGFEDGYLEQANITWADTERGRGPSGLTARTGKTHFFQDFAIEPAAAPWRDAALARGYRSSIAIPLLDTAGQVFALFTMYAGQPNGFTPAEVELLEDLAADISFGIGALRERKEREKAEEALQKAHDELELRIQERTGELGKVNQALDLERQRFNDVLESLPVYVILLAPDYHVPFANRFFRERFGESRGYRCYEYLFNRTEPCENCETYKVLKTNLPHHWEWTGPDKRNYDIYDFPFRDVDGSPLIMEVGIDITRQKQAQEELRQAHDELEVRIEERTRELVETRDYLDNLFNYANAPIIVWDLEFKITRFNHAFERITGYTAEEVIGKRLDMLFPAESHDESMRHIQEATSGERWEVVEIPIMHKDGTQRILLWNSANIFSPDGGTVVATIAQGQDITERKEAEEREKQAAQEWQTTFDSIEDMVSIQDKDFKLVRVNKAYATAVGMGQEGLKGKTCFSVIHGAVCPIENCPHRETMETQKTVIREIFEPGLGIYCEVTTSPVYNMKGELSGSVHIIRDITERKKAEQLKDEFISLVSHELRTPMTIITGSLQTATSAGISREDKELLIQNAIIGAAGLSAILENLLELSRYQAGRLQLHKESVSIPVVALAVIEKLKVQNEGRSFLTDFPANLPLVDADPIRVERILYNLLENAAKYSQEGSEIRVFTHRRNHQIVTGVADKGVGISPENQGRLFELFERLGRGTRSKGLGLGLVVCKRLVEAQGGKIWVESVPGKGSTFYFTLPVHENE